MKQYHIKFYQNRKIFFGISIGIMLIGVICNVIFGTQLDVQFRGGAVVKYSYTGSVDQEDVQKAVQDATGKTVAVTINENVKFADGSEAKNQVALTFAGNDALPVDQQQAILATLSEKYPDDQFTMVESSSVDPSMGREFFMKCMISVLLASILLVIYVAFRFKKIGGASAGVMAVIALLHDVLMVYFTFIIFRMPLNDSFIAVVLTILGYSLNNTIIIYDRIRENRRLMGPKAEYAGLVDLSINQTLTRSVYTAGCTFVAIAAVCFTGMAFGLASVTTFALPMMIGVLCGCFSSVCITGPLNVMWQKYRQNAKLSNKKA